jgi:hypothetical protein
MGIRRTVTTTVVIQRDNAGNVVRSTTTEVLEEVDLDLSMTTGQNAPKEPE